MRQEQLDDGKVKITFSGTEQHQLGVSGEYTLPDHMPTLRAQLMGCIGDMMLVGAADPMVILAQIERACPKD